jgi:hypothetical protein
MDVHVCRRGAAAAGPADSKQDGSEAGDEGGGDGGGAAEEEEEVVEDPNHPRVIAKRAKIEAVWRLLNMRSVPSGGEAGPSDAAAATQAAGGAPAAQQRPFLPSNKTALAGLCKPSIAAQKMANTDAVGRGDAKGRWVHTSVAPHDWADPLIRPRTPRP